MIPAMPDPADMMRRALRTCANLDDLDAITSQFLRLGIILCKIDLDLFDKLRIEAKRARVDSPMEFV
jgi:hypothetical protein